MCHFFILYLQWKIVKHVCVIYAIYCYSSRCIISVIDKSMNNNVIIQDFHLEAWVVEDADHKDKGVKIQFIHSGQLFEAFLI